jgi:pyruvate,water dikinase
MTVEQGTQSSPFLRYEVDYERPPQPVSLCGRGFVGGKAIGLMYAASQIQQESWSELAHGDLVRVPETSVLTSEFFDRFHDYNRLSGAYAELEYPELVRRYLAARFPDSDREVFKRLVAHMDYPLAIRSSSLLEDNVKYSFAGIYLTLFIPNTGTPEERLDQFEAAVKRVFASTYNPNAHAYRRHHGLRGKDEKMCVLVQRMIGKRYGNLFYPPMAGVAFSYNYFPWSTRIQAEDGLVRLVFGLGTRAVGRHYARVFSPTQPELSPEGSVVDQIVRYSQDYFDAVDLATGKLVSPNITEAVGNNPELPRVCSVLVGDDLLQEPSLLGMAPGERPVVTFRSILRSDRYMPLVPLIRNLLKGLEVRFGIPVDVEFACNFDQDEGHQATFYLLQCRPLGVRAKHQPVQLPNLEGRTVVFSGGRCMGNGHRDDVKHLIYVSPSVWFDEDPRELARSVGRLAHSLEGAPFILAGPGRWGTNHRELGIPVTYGEIAGSAVLVEIAAGRGTPELSYGTHFFGDLVAQDTYYMPVFPERGDKVDKDWLDAQPNAGDEPHVKLIVPPQGFAVTFDGHTREAAVYLGSDPGRHFAH